jgi:hypothetical protein
MDKGQFPFVMDIFDKSSPRPSGHSPVKVTPSEYQDYRKFEFFQLLPLQIRQIIWRLSLPGPRFIRTRPFQRSISKSSHKLDVCFSYYSNNPSTSPTALYVCNESRQVALSIYRRLRVMDPRSKPIYFSHDRDTLQFTGLDKLFQELLSQGINPQDIVELSQKACWSEARQCTRLGTVKFSLHPQPSEYMRPLTLTSLGL